MKVSALVPALDCSRTIGRVVRGLKQHVGEVLVVDDGSTDRTAQTARRAGAEVVSHGVNLGKGAALRTGFAWLADTGATHVLTVDGDGQHLPAEAEAVLAEAKENPGALVIGSRRSNAEATPLKRFGNDFANLWVWIASGKDLPDTQSGFRVYPLEATIALGALGDRFDFETEVLIRAARAGIEIRSVPIQVYYPPPEERVSHYDPLWDTVRIIRSVVELLLRVR